MSLDKNHGREPFGPVSGCMVCGGALIYSPDLSFACPCAFCGKTVQTHAFCVNGHFVCDECHRKDILERVEETCVKSALTDPAELLAEIFCLPGLHMHGPEYHSIVPAVLVTAYCNREKREKDAAIREAIRRGRDIIGGICGSHGACGAAIGAGIAYAVLDQTTPYSTEGRGGANRITAHALLAIGETNAPRCCKRDSMLAVETAVRELPGFISSGWFRYQCSQFAQNENCIKERCPYYPKRGDKRDRLHERSS